MNEVTRLFDFFYFQLKNFPKADMLTSKVNGKWAPLSTQDVSGLVNRLSAGLMKLGLSGNDMTVENQDKVALISRNRPEWLILDLACQQIGIALCPIYPTTNPLELEFIFNDAAVKYVFLSGEDILEKVNNVQHQTPSLKEVYSFDDDGIATSWKSLLENISQEDLEKVEKLKQEILPSHCATIIYTSGTTGKPKGVMLSHNNIVSNVMNSVESFPFPLHTHAKALSFLPLNHIFERMVSYIYFNSGISIYYADSLETIGEDLKDIKPQLFCTVPRLLEKVYEKIMLKGAELTGIKKKLFYWAIELGNKYDSINKGNMSYRLQLAIANKLIFSKWREALGNNIEFIITGGAACQVRLLRVFTAAKIPIYEGYGPTENSPVISVNTRKQVKFGTVGPVLKGQQVKLEPDGEICVKGPSVCLLYTS
ncbi:MAG TPA: long-chain fatty acid--CoA ligase, partial [Chitinophagaceae bacterium]|nr:long-chain fatty acid--CoA ligase [Chitinophagaceae bacterium]